MLAKLLKLSVFFLCALMIVISSASYSEEFKVDKEYMLRERVIGNADAKVRIDEYASFTCGHCASFMTNTFPELKKNYIDTGKIQFVYHDFPLDTFAFRASLMTRCASEENYYDLVQTLFQAQDRMFSSTDPEKFLIQLGALVGITEEQYKDCALNEDVKQIFLEKMREVQKKYNITGVPAMVINGGEEVLEGYKTYNQLKEILEKYTG